MSAPAEAQKLLFAGKTAAILGGVFLGIYALFAAMGAMDRSQRNKLEAVDSPSAAGDPAGLALPPTAALPVIRGGVPFVFIRYEMARDDAMRKAGTDDAGKIPLYRRLKGDDSFKAGIYAKIGPGLYVLLGESK